MAPPKGYKQSAQHVMHRMHSFSKYLETKKFTSNIAKANAASHARHREELLLVSTLASVSYEEAIRLKHCYRVQKADAKRRGIDFIISFVDWMTVWASSGKLKLRGRCDGQFVMARRGDRGPYSVENVVIITANKNTSDRHKNNG